jgi:hypothetical protein
MSIWYASTVSERTADRLERDAQAQVHRLLGLQRRGAETRACGVLTGNVLISNG